MKRQVVELEGYGKLQGQTETAQFLRMDGNRIVLGFLIDDELQEVPFKEIDGTTVGSSPEGGYRIPSNILLQITKGKGMSKTATVEMPTTGKGKTPPPATAANGKNGKNGSAPPVTTGQNVTGTPEEPTETFSQKMARLKREKAARVAEEEAKAAKKAKKAEKAEVTATPPLTVVEGGKPATTKKAPPKATVPAETPSAKKETTAKKPATVTDQTTGETRELTPMELETDKVREPGEGEHKIGLTPLMYRQIMWQHGPRAFPDGRKVPGYTTLKKSLLAACERSYVFVIVTKPAAEYLIQKVFKAGFEGDWRGPMLGAFKRGAYRITQELSSAFGLDIPAIIAKHGEEPPPAEKRPRGRPPGSGKKAEAVPAPPAKSGKASKSAAPVKKKPKLTIKKR